MRYKDRRYPLINQQDNLLGSLFHDKLNRYSSDVIKSGNSPNNLYWIKVEFPVDLMGINMLDLRYVEYMDPIFYIKPFKKD